MEIPAETCEQLSTIDTSIFFIVFIIAAVLLSLRSVFLQRRQLTDAACGYATEQTAAYAEKSVFKHKFASSFMVVMALVYFFALAQQSVQSAQGPVAAASSKRNLIASLFVLAAAAVRFYDLIFVNNASTAAGALSEMDSVDDGAASSAQAAPTAAE